MEIIDRAGWLIHEDCLELDLEIDVVLSRNQVLEMQANQATIDWAEAVTLPLDELIDTHEGLSEHLSDALQECWDTSVDLDVVDEVRQFLAGVDTFGQLLCEACHDPIS